MMFFYPRVTVGPPVLTYHTPTAFNKLFIYGTETLTYAGTFLSSYDGSEVEARRESARYP